MSAQQPESLGFIDHEEKDITFHEYLIEDENQDFHRGGATPGKPEKVEDFEEYLENGEDEELGPVLLEEALKEDHDIQDVTEYHVRGFGGTDYFGMLIAVEYSLESSNSEAKAVAKSESTASPGF